MTAIVTGDVEYLNRPRMHLTIPPQDEVPVPGLPGAAGRGVGEGRAGPDGGEAGLSQTKILPFWGGLKTSF